MNAFQINGGKTGIYMLTIQRIWNIVDSLLVLNDYLHDKQEYCYKIHSLKFGHNSAESISKRKDNKKEHDIKGQRTKMNSKVYSNMQMRFWISFVHHLIWFWILIVGIVINVIFVIIIIIVIIVVIIIVIVIIIYVFTYILMGIAVTDPV